MTAKILLADDDVSVRKMLCRLLEMENYQVLLAGTGRQAVATFHAHAPDLILLDLKMPDQDGWQALDKMSASGPMPPVVIITASPHQERRAAQCGADALLEKPLHLPLLLETIKGLLSFRAHSQERELSENLCSTK